MIDKEFWRKFLTNNTPQFKLCRTIAQGIIGVIIANLDLLVSYCKIPNDLKPFIVAVVMAVLSPLMAQLGESLKADASVMSIKEPDDSFSDSYYSVEELAEIREANPIVTEEGGDADV